MNGTERLQLVMVKRAWRPTMPSMGAVGRGGLFAADVATDFMPVVGGIKNLGKGLYHAAKGQWGTALGDMGMAALGTFGMAGAARVGKLGLMGAKYLPTATKAMRAINAPGRAVAGKMMQNPGIIGKTTRTLSNNAGKSTLGAFGVTALGGHFQGISDDVARATNQSQAGMQNMLQQIHQSPVFHNPMYAEPQGSALSDIGNQFLR